MARITENPRKLFGKRLCQLRQARGISQMQLADLAGISWNYVGRLERAQQSPSLDMICVLAAVLNVKPAALLERGR